MIATRSPPRGPAAWTRIDYPQAIPDPDTGELVSAAEVAEIPFTAFTSKRCSQQVTARLVVRRIPELSAPKLAGQDPVFPLFRYHAVFTDSLEPLVQAEAQWGYSGRSVGIRGYGRLVTTIEGLALPGSSRVCQRFRPAVPAAALRRTTRS